MRRNYEEDWERRKTYLIRSLFQDIPQLSPVPEDPESRYSATSPSGVPPSRPHSPLPPLIIERVPNRHDHPDQFYQDLEKKMKKLYRKLFYNARSGSIDDLIEEYGGEIEFLTSRDLHEESRANYEINEGNKEIVHSSPNYVYEQHYQTSTPNKSTAGEETLPPVDDIDIRTLSNTNYFSKNSNFEEPQSQIVESSTQSLFATQITIVADVHAPSGPREVEETLENSTDEVSTVVLSPILRSRQVNIACEKAASCQEDEEKHNVSGQDQIQEEVETENNDSIEDAGAPQYEQIEEDGIYHNSGSNEDEYSGGDHDDTSFKENLESNLSKKSNKSMELMRRQENISSSLGSLPLAPIGSPSSEISVTYTDVDFQKNMSLERSELDMATECETEMRPKSLENTSNNLSISSSSSLFELRHVRFLREARKRRRINSSESSAQFTTKKIKYNNAGIQTTEVEDTGHTNGWNQLKTTFFVGIPKIYKLCSCNDHSCKNTIENN